MSFLGEAGSVAAQTAGLCAFVVASLLVATRRLHARFSADAVRGVQRNHRGLIPRIGGLPLLAGTVLGWYFSAGETRQMLKVFLLSGSLAFGFGLLEDLTRRVSVRTRLLATMGSGLLAWAMSGVHITDIDLPGLGPVLLWTPFAVLFTAFAVGGVANAFNLIDGFNGLAVGTALLQLSALGLLSIHLGDGQLSAVCLVLAAAAAGFMLLNWPFGRLFLGDGGAYFLGFAVAWVAVLLLYRHTDVSAWCPLLICAYPVLEVLFSMWRRHMRRRGVGQADRLHLHSLLKRRVVRQWLPHASQLMRNSVTGVLMWFITLPLAALGFAWQDQTLLLMLCLAVFVLLYQVLYVRLIRFHWCLPGRAKTVPGQKPVSIPTKP